MATTVQEIENKGLAYKFIRGSHLYGTNVEGKKYMLHIYIYGEYTIY